jgi:hypothetical protein
MSAKGHFRRSARALDESGLPPTADISLHCSEFALRATKRHPFCIKNLFTFVLYAYPGSHVALEVTYERKSPICPRPAARHDV